MAYVSIPYNAGGTWGPPVPTTADLPFGANVGSARVVLADAAVYMYDGAGWSNVGLTAPGVTSINMVANGPDVTIQGTASQITVGTVGDVLTLSTPQNIATTSSPTFAGLTVGNTTGSLITTAGVVSTQALTDGQLLIGSTGVAPVAASITGTTNRVSVTAGAGSITLSGPQDIDSTASPTFSALTITNNVGANTITSTTTASVGTDLTLVMPGTGMGTALVRDGTGVVVELTSSRSFKENIRNITDAHDVKKIITSLVGRKYNYKSEPSVDSFGFIAEEVETICKEIVIYKDGKPHSLNYNAFIPIITEYLKILNEENNKIVTKTKELSALLNKHIAVKVTQVTEENSEIGLIDNRYLPIFLSILAIIISIALAYPR